MSNFNSELARPANTYAHLPKELLSTMRQRENLQFLIHCHFAYNGLTSSVSKSKRSFIFAKRSECIVNFSNSSVTYADITLSITLLHAKPPNLVLKTVVHFPLTFEPANNLRGHSSSGGQLVPWWLNRTLGCLCTRRRDEVTWGCCRSVQNHRHREKDVYPMTQRVLLCVLGTSDCKMLLQNWVTRKDGFWEKEQYQEDEKTPERL